MKKRVCLCLLMVLVLLCIFGGCASKGSEEISSSPAPTRVPTEPPLITEPPTQTPTPIDKVTVENYNKIKNGMSYGEVARLLGGPGEECGSTGELSTYLWDSNKPYAYIQVVFSNGKVASKSKYSLD